MDIAIFIGSYISQGLDSPTPGEGRWAQNLAKMLAAKGHKVDCIGTDQHHLPPSWGTSKPIPNVTLWYGIDTNKVYDISIYTPWTHPYGEGCELFNMDTWKTCLEIPIKSKIHVHCQFSWSPSIANDHTCYENGHVLAYPYMQDGEHFPGLPENPYKTFLLPIPIFDELAEINLSGRKDILWSTKDVFHPDWGSVDHHCPRIGMATLRAIKKLSEKHEFTTYFLSTRYFNPSVSWVSRDLGVAEVAKSIPNSNFCDLLPKDKLLDIMSKTRITAVVSGLLGSFGESIAMGAVPLCYRGHLYADSAEKYGIMLNTFEATENEIYSCMEKLYRDDSLYEKVIKDYQHDMRYHSYEASYQCFLDMVNTLM